MTAPTSPWNIPLFGVGDTIGPIASVFNSQSNALNTALNSVQLTSYLQYTTRAAMNLVAGTVVGQHATVNADGTAANNGDYQWNGTAWVPFRPVLSHAEYTYAISGLVDGLFSTGGLTADATRTTDSTFTSVVSSKIRVQPGASGKPAFYTISFTPTISVAATGRCFAEIVTTADTVGDRSYFGVGESQGSAVITTLVTTANTDIQLNLFKTTGGSCNVSGRVRVTQIA